MLRGLFFQACGSLASLKSQARDPPEGLVLMISRRLSTIHKMKLNVQVANNQLQKPHKHCYINKKGITHRIFNLLIYNRIQQRKNFVIRFHGEPSRISLQTGLFSKATGLWLFSWTLFIYYSKTYSKALCLLFVSKAFWIVIKIWIFYYYKRLLRRLLRSYLVIPDVRDVKKKYSKLVWRCHHFVFEFLVNGQLPRMSRRSLVSANVKGDNEMIPVVLHRSPGIYLTAEENLS